MAEDSVKAGNGVKHHWGFIVGGILLLICSIFILVAPGPTLLTLVIIAGIAMVVSGLIGLISYIGFRERLRMSGWTLAYSIIDILIGLIFLIHPLVLAYIIPWMMAAFMLISGLFEIMASVRVRSAGTPAWTWTLLSGIVTLLCAVMLFIAPATIGIFLGLFVFLRGISLIMYGWRAGSHRLVTE